ncbi:MAG: acyl carrier protein [Planctomycetaceae bacterium]|nr:acyl carrier protein [Planctomycetaceae bacterium]
MDNLNETILAVVRGVVKEKNPELTAIRPDQLLVEDLGLRSLDLARIIAKLEVKLDVDPFAELVSITSIRTPGDLCAAYAKCFEDEEESAPPEESEPAATRSRPGLESQRELRKRARD